MQSGSFMFRNPRPPAAIFHPFIMLMRRASFLLQKNCLLLPVPVFCDNIKVAFAHSYGNEDKKHDTISHRLPSGICGRPGGFHRRRRRTYFPACIFHRQGASHVALGTNKLSSAMGTTVSTARLARHGYLKGNVLMAICSAAAAVTGSALGAASP